ncbi:hypothetical protein PoB_003400400 [Plakobranchus ocellatus]|uniref:Uncharacterized protein n=1 Tax=Plakobranchus ocellatus TaxID=259542 RepID=A0AAV4AMT0_9GAST|nr:hypothetical protein PoB_003400400 [Plakobranchus ocellatus]
MQPAARSYWKNKPFFVTKLRMAVRFNKPVSSPWASASPMECPPSPSKPQPPSKSCLPPPAEKPQGPPPSPSPPYPFTPEVHVAEGVKPTIKIKGLAGQPTGNLPSNK